MNLTSYTKNLFIILWNIITLLCPFISQSNTKEKETYSFSGLSSILIFLDNVYKNIKELSDKIISKPNNTKTAKILAVAKSISKNQHPVLNRVNANKYTTSQAKKSTNLLNSKRLKDALATQILISKQHFFRLGDKCAFLYPFLSKNHCSLYIF